MKKVLSILLACLILSFSFAGATFAEEAETATVIVLEDVLVRTGGSAGRNYGSADQYWVSKTESSYLKFDVRTLREAMNDKEAKYTLSLNSKADSALGDIYVYGISGENRISWSESSLTYNMTHETVGNGMDTDVSNLLGKITVSEKNMTFTLDITDYIESLPSDGIATLKLQNKNLADEVIKFFSKENTANKPATLTATRTYREGTEAVFDGIELPKIATETVNLPAIGDIYGSTLSWESSNPDVITAEGFVTRQSKAILVTLTATYVGYDITKSFDVIVPKAGENTSATIFASEDTFTHKGSSKGVSQAGVVQGSNLLAIDKNRTSYIKFNVTTLREALNNKDAKYTLQFASKNDSYPGIVNVYGITGDNRTDWSDDTLTYNLANEKGLDGDVTNKIGEVNVAAKNTIYTVDITDYILSVPADGIATLKLENQGLESPVVIQSLEGASDDYKPVLIAERTYKEVTVDVFDGIEIPKVVIENLNLPTLSPNDETITWISSNPEVIAIDGTVTRQNGEAVVTLTAECDGKTKSFEVIVPKIGESASATINVTEDTFTRTGIYGSDVHGDQILVVSSNGRTTYLKFDISALRTAMTGKDAKYTLQFATNEDKNNNTAANVNVYGIIGKDWSENELTYDIAAENGLDTDVTNKIGEISVVGKNATFTIDVTDYIMSIPTDSNVATIKLENKENSDPEQIIVLASKEKAPTAAATLTAERIYTDNYTNGINPTMYVNGKVATELSGGVATARVAFIGNSATDEPKATLILALYNGEALEKIKSVSSDFSEQFVNDMSVSVDVPEGEGYSVKAILIKGFDTLIPMTPFAELK